MSETCRNGRGVPANLVWLIVLIAIIAAIAAVWFRGDDLFAPSRETAVVKIFREANPAVVNISAEPVPNLPDFGMWPDRMSPRQREFFKMFLGEGRQETNLGSGIIVDPEGYILTNEHLVLNTSRIQVTLADGRTMDGEIWGTEPSLDLAVIKIDGQGALPYLRRDRVADPIVGEDVVVIGNPLGLGASCSTGIVSALNRQVRSGNRVYKHLIQTDAAVNPGNSGGPMIDIRGELLGITTAEAPQSEGIGFAIPIKLAYAVVDDLILYRYVPTGWLGLTLAGAGVEANGLDLPRGRGVTVTEVAKGSPAARDFEDGDTIVEWDGETLYGLEDFIRKARRMRPGDRVTLTRSRDGSSKQIKLRAAAFPEDEAMDWAWYHLGVDVRESSYQAVAANGMVVTRNGVFISRVNPGSPAQVIGLAPGDQIQRINREAIGSAQDFKTAISRYRDRGNVFLQVRRGNYALPVTIPFRQSGERW